MMELVEKKNIEKSSYVILIITKKGGKDKLKSEQVQLIRKLKKPVVLLREYGSSVTTKMNVKAIYLFRDLQDKTLRKVVGKAQKFIMEQKDFTEGIFVI